MNDNNLVDAYVVAFSRMINAEPGTTDFEIEQKTVETLWEQLSVEDRAIAHEKTAPYKTRLITKK